MIADRPRSSGLVQGGLGGSEDEMLEAGRIEHHADTQTSPDPNEIEPSSPNANQGASHG